MRRRFPSVPSHSWRVLSSTRMNSCALSGKTTTSGNRLKGWAFDRFSERQTKEFLERRKKYLEEKMKAVEEEVKKIDSYYHQLKYLDVGIGRFRDLVANQRPAFPRG